MLQASFPVEFLGGSADGAMIEATTAPDYCELRAGEVREIYQRQNEEPPFIYLQIGYVEDEDWQ